VGIEILQRKAINEIAAALSAKVPHATDIQRVDYARQCFMASYGTAAQLVRRRRSRPPIALQSVRMRQHYARMDAAYARLELVAFTASGVSEDTARMLVASF